MPIQNSALSRATYSTVSNVTPSDSTDLPRPAAGGLFVTATGNVSFVCGGTTVNLTAVAANTRLPFVATRVRSTGTTATVVALS